MAFASWSLRTGCRDPSISRCSATFIGWKGRTRRYSQHVCLSRSVLTHGPRQAHVWLIFDVRHNGVSEEDYIVAIRDAWPKDGEAPLTLIALADEATVRFPDSPRLWCMRGNLIELGPEDSPHELSDALASYERAVRIEPAFAEGWEEIAHFHDVVLDDEASAKRFFEQAAAIRKNA